MFNLLYKDLKIKKRKEKNKDDIKIYNNLFYYYFMLRFHPD